MSRRQKASFNDYYDLRPAEGLGTFLKINFGTKMFFKD